MKKGVIIATAVLLALLAAVGIMISTKQKNDSPQVRIIEDSMDNNANTNNIMNTDDEMRKAQDAQMAELRAQLEDLERKMAQQKFDYATLKAEKDRLEQQNSDLADQNSWLKNENSTLSSSENKLKEDVSALNEELASLNEKLDQMSAERDKDEAAYQEALAKIEEYEAKVAAVQASSDAAGSVPDTQSKEDDSMVSVSKTASMGQSRNIIGIKAGESDVDIEGTFALLPHWFLVTEIGIIDAPDDFVETEFPGLTADHAFMYTALFGTGLNWRINSLHGQPNLYIETMLGPAVYKYVIKSDDDKGINTYLLWRSAVGFDLTLYKNLQFTTEVGLDYIVNCELTPRVTVGLQYNFSNSWALFGRKK